MATSKLTVFSVKILEHFGLSGYFDFVAGSELDGTRVEKAEVIEYALSESGSAREQVVMVGDREHDIIGARKNGLAVIAVNYGYGTEAELKAAQPDYIAASVAELTKLLTVTP